MRRMRNHSRGFVDHDDVGVFINDRQVDRFGFDDERRARLYFAVDRVAFGNNVAAFDRLAIHAQIADRRGLRYERAWKTGAVRERYPAWLYT